MNVTLKRTKPYQDIRSSSYYTPTTTVQSQKHILLLNSSNLLPITEMNTNVWQQSALGETPYVSKFEQEYQAFNFTGRKFAIEAISPTTLSPLYSIANQVPVYINISEELVFDTVVMVDNVYPILPLETTGMTGLFGVFNGNPTVYQLTTGSLEELLVIGTTASQSMVTQSAYSYLDTLINGNYVERLDAILYKGGAVDPETMDHLTVLNSSTILSRVVEVDEIIYDVRTINASGEITSGAIITYTKTNNPLAITISRRAITSIPGIMPTIKLGDITLNLRDVIQFNPTNELIATYTGSARTVSIMYNRNTGRKIWMPTKNGSVVRSRITTESGHSDSMFLLGSENQNIPIDSVQNITNLMGFATVPQTVLKAGTHLLNIRME